MPVSNMARHSNKRYAMSKNQRRTLLLCGVLLLFALSTFDKWAGKGVRTYLLTPTPKGTDAKKYHNKTFKVISVVDGDTIDIDIADGKYDQTRIRLLGVDTPETKNPRTPEMYYGAEASNFAKNTLLNKDVKVIIDTVSDVRDRYNRLLGYIEIDGKVFNEEIVRSGYGYADLRFKHSQLSRYAQMQEQAVKQKIGLWKEVQPDDLPAWLNREYPNILELRN